MATGEGTKGRSPFYPGQPVPVELFVGRKGQIERVMTRGVGQVAQGKPMAVFVEGEYGIGKSSLAGCLQAMAQKEHSLHPIYAPLGGAATLEDLGQKVLEATIRSGALAPQLWENLKNWLGKYIGEQSLFGFTFRADVLRTDAPSIASGMLPFLTQVYTRLREAGIQGLFLVLDEINGITRNPQFAHFVKSLVDTNAMSSAPLPLLLMLCGVEERRREMIGHHQPVERIFDVIQVEALAEEEVRDFFERAFSSVDIAVQQEGLELLVYYSAGFPKIMHLVGDAAYWGDDDGVIDEKDALNAVFVAADDVGKKYVDQQVYKALRSKDYQSIFKKIAQLSPTEMAFRKRDVEKGLTDSEKRKFHNFLQKMKKLSVLRAGESRGEYEFNIRMVRLYIWLRYGAVKVIDQ